jgi:hypothetical protein
MDIRARVSWSRFATAAGRRNEQLCRLWDADAAGRAGIRPHPHSRPPFVSAQGCYSCFLPLLAPSPRLLRSELHLDGRTFEGRGDLDRKPAAAQTAFTRRCADEAGEGRRGGSASCLDGGLRGKRSSVLVSRALVADQMLMSQLECGFSLLRRSHASDRQDLALDSLRSIQCNAISHITF